MFFVTGESTLHVAFVKYILSKLYGHCTQNSNFNYYSETRICFVTKKIFNILIGLHTYFVRKTVQMILENHSLKSLDGMHI